VSDPQAAGEEPDAQEPDAQEPDGQEPAAAGPGDGQPAGPALARAVLDAAKARRGPVRRRRTARGDGGPGADAVEAADGLRPARGAGWSGAGPDRRDPQPFSEVLAKLVKARGWERPAAEATLFARWEQVVGAEIADHCHPVKLDGGELTIEATSTSWATQLRLLAGSILKKIAAEVGHNVVTRLRVHGPAAPSWNRGPRRVRGRGPRDTYG
jgi:predicted nucleic acid-binding Zn ribbon protein